MSAVFQSSFVVCVREDCDRHPDDIRPVVGMTSSGLAVWVAVERSAKVLAFHVTRALAAQNNLEPLVEIRVTGVVNKVLAGKRVREGILSELRIKLINTLGALQINDPALVCGRWLLL